MKKVNYKEIGEKLRKAREYLSLTQAQVARILNVGRDAIIRIESGTRKIDAEELSKFSELYKISVDEIINSQKYEYTESAFARGFDKLSEKDQKEILNLIKLKNEYKSKEG
ncbi:MAG: helix-turn-helix transcriptional regulator [Clostridiales bacterium]|jgi:transcriptional regulator with XRE-family HTH domain|nr:helix-turn-helix transcriptional regulator [Clostridiales bacterium]